MANVEKEEPLRSHFIPDNFVENGRVLNGMFKTRNFVEACVLAVPVAVLVYFLTGFLPTNWRVAIIALFTVLVFAIGAYGWQGESLMEFAQHVMSFHGRRRIAKYNPRVKHESRPEYLVVGKAKTPMDIIVEKARAKIMGTEEDDYDPNDEIDSSDVSVVFEDDMSVDGVNIPDALKTKKQLKEDEKRRKQREKEIKKAMRERDRIQIEIEQEANNLIKQQRRKTKKRRG